MPKILISTRTPYQKILFLLSFGLLGLMLAFFAELQGLHHTYLKTLDKRDLVALELCLVILVLVNSALRFPDIRRLSLPILMAGGFWLVWSFVSAVTANSFYLALYTYAEHLVLLLFGVSVFALISKYEDSRKYLLWIILAGFLVYCLFLFNGYFLAGERGATLPFDVSLREVGFTHVRHLGYYLAIVLVVVSGLGSTLRYAESRWLAWLAWLAGIIAAAAWALVFWAGGRGPLVAVFVTLVVMIVLFGGLRKSRRLLLFVATTAFAGALLSLLLPGGYGHNYLFSRLLVAPDGVSSLEELNRFSSSRLDIWAACAVDIVRNPFFGIGQNGYSLACGSGFKGTIQPHGFHIQAALDWGIPGAVAFITFIGLILNRALVFARSTIESSPERVIAVSAAVMLLVFSAFDGTLFQRFTLMFFVVFLAMSLPSESSSREVEEYHDGRTFFVFLLMVVVAILLYLSLSNYMLVPEYTTIG